MLKKQIVKALSHEATFTGNQMQCMLQDHFGSTGVILQTITVTTVILTALKKVMLKWTFVYLIFLEVA